MSRRSRRIVPQLRSSEALREALEQLEAITRFGHNRRRIIEDWIALMFWALQRNDPEYLAILANYDHGEGEKQKAAGHFATAFHLLMAYMRETNQEALGLIWTEFCANKDLGQFFTPPEVSRLMAAITLHSMPEEGPIRISEPCAGAGGMIVAAVKEMTCAQVDRAIFVAQDIDRACCMMTTLNMCFFNVNGVIIHGDSSNPEDVRGAWETHRSYVWGGSIRPYPLDLAREWKQPPKPRERDERAEQAEEAPVFLLRPFEDLPAGKPRQVRGIKPRKDRPITGQGSLFD